MTMVELELRPTEMIKSLNPDNCRENDIVTNYSNNNDIPNVGNNYVLSSFPFILKGKKCHAIINHRALVFEYESSPNVRTVIPLEDVISVWPCQCQKVNRKNLLCECITKEKSASLSETSANSAQNSLQNNLITTIVRLYHAIPIGKYGWKIELIALETSTSCNQASLYEWLNVICNQIDGFKRPKKLLIFVNPYGGKKKAVEIYEKKVYPLFQLSGIKSECIITERANHAKDILQNIDYVKDYDGIVCVGGDGMFSELLNGVLIKAQKDADVNWSSSQSTLKSPSITIGVIPAGSTDAVAYGTTGVNDPITSTVHIILGKKIDIDVCSIHHRDEDRLIRYATSFLGYGYFGDISADSERNRWMGPRRYDWAGVKKYLGHRMYNGEIRLCVTTNDGSPKDNTMCTSNCNQCLKSAINLKTNDPYTDTACISIRGRFLAINAATMSCRCAMTKHGISPSAHLGNGCVDLILVSQCSRFNYLKYLLRTGFSSKSPFDLGFVDVYRVREFEFNPIVGPGGYSSNKYQLSTASVWNCDGEVINVPAIQVKVHCQLVTIFGTGIELRDRNTHKSAMI